MQGQVSEVGRIASPSYLTRGYEWAGLDHNLANCYGKIIIANEIRND